MKADFWLERWQREEIGFHQDEINTYLCKYWSEIHLTRGCTVFVPLCGKSRDMLWLREQGHPVLGVELSNIAVNAFFKENGFIPVQSTFEPYNCYEADGIRILCGDFFNLSADAMKDVGAVYDRASLIALPHEMRRRYAQHLASILPRGTPILLITVEYLQTEMQGPPFSVDVNEVELSFGDFADIRLLAQLDVLEQNPRFQERGLSRLQENIFLLSLL